MSDLLATLNVAQTQLHHIGWGFIRAFELVYEALEIDPTMRIFFSFFELKRVGMGSWVSLSGLPGRNLFWGGNRSLNVLYE